MFSGKYLERLPFSTYANKHLDVWPLIQNLTWTQGCVIGRLRADQLVIFMREFRDPLPLVQVNRAMIIKGDHGALNVGFSTRLAEMLLTCEQHKR